MSQQFYTSTQWVTNNPVLANGDEGIETDTNRVKIGNGTTDWNDLPYVSSGLWLGSTTPIDTYPTSVFDVETIVLSTPLTGLTTPNTAVSATDTVLTAIGELQGQISAISTTSPHISTIINTGTLTLPTATDTLVGRATTDTLTNKTMDGGNNTFSNIPKSAVGLANVANVDTSNAANISSGILSTLRGGTGVSNGYGITLTNGTLVTYGGNVVLTAQSPASVLTLPASGTVATLAGTETLTNKTVNGVTLSTASGTTAFLR